MDRSPGDRVDHAGLELHEGVVVVADGLRLAAGEGVGQILLVALQHVQGGGVDLRHDVLVSKIIQRA